MSEFVLDPHDGRPARPHAARRAELRDRVLHEAQVLARRHDLELVCRPPVRPEELAMLWFQGDRVRVLHAIGGWDPDAPVELRIAHAARCGGRYELALYAALRRDATPVAA